MSAIVINLGEGRAVSRVAGDLTSGLGQLTTKRERYQLKPDNFII